MRRSQWRRAVLVRCHRRLDGHAPDTARDGASDTTMEVAPYADGSCCELPLAQPLLLEWAAGNGPLARKCERAAPAVLVRAKTCDIAAQSCSARGHFSQ